MWMAPLEYVQIHVYYNLHTDTGTRTRVNVNAALYPDTCAQKSCVRNLMDVSSYEFFPHKTFTASMACCVLHLCINMTHRCRLRQQKTQPTNETTQFGQMHASFLCKINRAARSLLKKAWPMLESTRTNRFVEGSWTWVTLLLQVRPHSLWCFTFLPECLHNARYIYIGCIYVRIAAWFWLCYMLSRCILCSACHVCFSEVTRL